MTFIEKQLADPVETALHATQYFFCRQRSKIVQEDYIKWKKE